MSPKVLAWLMSGHLIGLFLWIGAMCAAYWILRFHTHAPKEVHEKLTLIERSLGMMMDLAATLAMGCGLALALGQDPNLFAAPKSGWFHIKLTVVVLGVLPVHGMIRARIKKFSQGKISDVPQWQWTALVASVAAISILVFVVRLAMRG